MWTYLNPVRPVQSLPSRTASMFKKALFHAQNERLGHKSMDQCNELKLLSK